MEYSSRIKYSSFMIVFLSLFFFTGSCASIPYNAVNEGRYIPADFLGVVHAGMTNTVEENDLIDYMGITWLLETFNWNRIEPQQGNWDFQRYDTFVDNAIANNVNVIGVLAYETPWIFEEGMARRKYIPPEKIPEFLNYVRTTVEHFKGRVGAWCVWNEPNWDFWTGTDAEFFELSRRAIDAVREVDTEVILLGGAVNRNITGLRKKFIRGLFESGGLKNTDYIAFHPYDTNVKTSVRTYENFRKIVDEYGFSERIWITEMGYPTGGWYPTRVTQKNLPKRVIQTIAYHAYAGAKKLLWYQMYDPAERVLSDSEDFFGLVRSREDYTSKGAEAFRLCALYMQGAACYALTDGLPGSIQAFWYQGEEKSALVLWKEGLGSNQVNILLPGTNHLLHNIVTGNANSISKDIVVKIGSDPVFITYSNTSGSSDNKPVFK